MIARCYLFCVDNPDVYQDDIQILAEGLQYLKVSVAGSCDYWRMFPDGPFLVQKSPFCPAGTDIAVLGYKCLRRMTNDFHVSKGHVPEEFHNKSRTYRTVVIDLEDGYDTPTFCREINAVDTVFRAKYNCRCYHPANHTPWVHGFSSRVIQCVENQRLFCDRNRSALVNFNASHPYPHGTRRLFTERFARAISKYYAIDRTTDDLSLPPEDPWHRLMWQQTQQRHSPAYYARLCSSQIIAAFCGEMIPPAPFRPDYLVGGKRAAIRRKIYETLGKFDSRPPRSIQWDSWRFWEGLAAGCAVFNIDLEYYGVKLPVMPVHGEHYIGLRLENLEETVDQFCRDPGRLARVAEQGRLWAMEHYAPAPLARRFLKELEFALL